MKTPKTNVSEPDIMQALLDLHCEDARKNYHCSKINCIDCMFDEDNLIKFTNWYKKQK